jgi:hypothetical protein
MVNKVIVIYDGALAHYEVRKNLLGSYTATLSYYEGEGGPPPSVVTLYAHEHSWQGHPGNKQLLDGIGRQIREQNF